jgi:hypothetical protein
LWCHDRKDEGIFSFLLICLIRLIRNVLRIRQ